MLYPNESAQKVRLAAGWRLRRRTQGHGVLCCSSG